MINVLIGIFYISLVALISYLFYFIIKIAIKDAYYEMDLNSEDEDVKTYDNTDVDD